jgi:hypothetical protein
LVCLASCPALAAGQPKAEPTEYFGLCSASAGVAVDANRFLVASDEDSVLRLYRVDKVDAPEQVYDLTSFLEWDGKSTETDIEAATRLGDRAFWITSHARNAKGKRRESRARFFATKLRLGGGKVLVEPEGRPYRQLLADLLSAPNLQRYGWSGASRLAPEEGGLNIEGLCAAPQGHLLIGLRSPLAQGRALLVPLLNPAGVITGERAQVGEPWELDLGGLGVRDLGLADGKYLIVGGPVGSKGKARLFLWDGGHAAPRRLDHARLKGLHPECVILYPGKGLREAQVLSDDGGRKIDGCPCNELADPAQRRFRGVWIKAQPGE